MEEAKEAISIMLFGLSGAGKTTLLGSLFNQMLYNSINKENENNEKISYAFEINENVHAGLPDVIKKINKDFNKGDFFPNGTDESADELRVTFNLKVIKGKEKCYWPIELSDYAGGSIDVFEAAKKIVESQPEEASADKEKKKSQQDDDPFKKRRGDLTKANVIFVLVDAIELAVCCKEYKSDVGRCAKKMSADSVNITLSDILEKKTTDNSDVTILFLLTKTDSDFFGEEGEYKEYAYDHFRKLREKVKEIYRKVFDEAYYQKNWAVGIVPVCALGQGNVTTTSKNVNKHKEGGKIQPKGIDIAFMYAVRSTCISRIATLGKETNEKDQEDIKRAADAGFIELDDQGNVVWECRSKIHAWIINREHAGEYKKIMQSAKTAQEKLKEMNPQFINNELERLEKLIEEGYHFNVGDNGVYDRKASISGV